MTISISEVQNRSGLRQWVAFPPDLYRGDPNWEPPLRFEQKELVGYRNEAAKKLGFANFHALQLTLSEQTGDELIKLVLEYADLYPNVPEERAR